MKGKPDGFDKFQSKFKPRVVFPNPEDPKTLTGRLRQLTTMQHVATRWVQHEIIKLLPEIEQLERNPPLYLGLGFMGGVLVMSLILLVYIGVN